MEYEYNAMGCEEEDIEDWILVDMILFCDNCKSEQGFCNAGTSVEWESVPGEDSGGYRYYMSRAYCVNCNKIKLAPLEPDELPFDDD